MRSIARRTALRLPFGAGRLMRELVSLRARVRELEHSRAEQAARDWRNAKRYAMAYRRLVAAAVGKKTKEIGVASTVAPPVEQSMADRDFIRTVRAKAQLVEHLQQGEPFEVAVAALIRAQLKAEDHLSARSLSQALQRQPATRLAGHLGSALVAAKMQLPGLAWTDFQEVPPEVWRPWAPGEYLSTGFQVDRPAALDAARQILETRPAELSPEGWIEVVKAVFGAREYELAAELFGVAESLAAQAPAEWAGTGPEREWLRPWFDRIRERPAPTPVPPGHVSLAILDYKQPDQAQTSRNVGDYVQTLASLGHVVRHRNVRFHGAPALAEVVTGLQARVRPEHQLESAARDVTLTAVNRDASSFDAVPDGTWVIAFGWYMQRIFGAYDFPLHPHLRPILISFHCNRPELLTPAALDYLRRYGPVGCRDWSTVDLLLSAGVPAFFSGCVTTTVNTVFPDLADGERPAAGAPMAYVDVKGIRDKPNVVTQETEVVRRSDLPANLRRATELMETYRRTYSAIRTSRLHCYLPVRSIGMRVEFTPNNPADVRFAGLVDLTDADFAAVQNGISTKLERVLSAIYSGDDEEKVYAIWRDLCAAEVEQARARLASTPPIPPPSFDVAAACATVRDREVVVERSKPGPTESEVHVALALDGNLKDEMKVVVEGLVDNSTSSLHLWVLCRDHGPADYRQLATLFPEVTFTWLPCDDVDYGPVLGMLKHITVSTMDRLLLPDLLPELDRIVYHDIDALPLADITELYRWDLQGQPLAARSAVARHVTSGFANILRSAKRLRDDTSAARDCLRRMYARHSYDFTAFNAGILVFDLARMRADEFVRHFIPFVERYGMNDQEVLNCYAGPNRAVLPPQWNSFPTQEPVRDPNIIHWAGPLKPWKREYVLLRERWAEYAARLQDRQRRVMDGGVTAGPAEAAAERASSLRDGAAEGAVTTRS
jgi:lipopolysaccharide biosynthesis glycosyltransferase